MLVVAARMPLAARCGGWSVGGQPGVQKKTPAAGALAPLDSPLDIVRRRLGGGVDSTYMCKLEISKKQYHTISMV